MSGFNDPIIGGQGALVRAAIKSPNFVPNVSGWSIDKNGNAYFFNVFATGTITGSTFIGTDFEITQDGAFFYLGTPALGNLMLSITNPNASGTDAYTNGYAPGGICMVGVAGVTNFLTLQDINANTLFSVDGNGNITGFDINANDDVFLQGESVNQQLNIITGNEANALPQGIIAYTNIDANLPTALNAGQFIFELDVSYPGNRTYKFSLENMYTAQSAATFVSATVYFTTDGTQPTVASAVLMEAGETAAGAGARPLQGVVRFRKPTSSENLRMRVYLAATAGATVQATAGTGADNWTLAVEDIGPIITNTGAYQGGGGSGGGPQNYTKTYYPTHTWSYYGSDATGGNANGLRVEDGLIYQGGESASGGGYNGTQYAFIDYSGTSIAADLSGATITSIKLTLTNKHSWYDSGMNVELWSNSNSHIGNNNSGKGNQLESSIGEGATKTFTLANAVGTGFGTGAIQSIQLGPDSPQMSLSNYGYFAGKGQSGQPVLVVKYTK